MEKIWLLTDQLVGWCGVTGQAVPVVRQLLLLAVTLLLAFGTQWLCRRIFIPLATRLTRRTKSQWDNVLLNERTLRSASQIVPAIIIASVLPILFRQMPTVHVVLERLAAIYITVMATRTVLVFIDTLGQKRDGRERTTRQQYLYTLCGVLKVVALFIAAIVVVALLLGKSPATLLAGLGATSAVMMLVFQDTITGLVAGVRLTSNDMLHVGDWITVEKSGVNGIVEEMTLTTVKVRNFDNTILTIPPKTLVGDVFQNWKGMRQSAGRKVVRRVYFDFRSVRVTDGEANITRFRRHVEQWLAQQPTVNPEMTILARQADATQQGMAVEFIFFLHERGGVPFEHAISDIMEYIFATAPEYGLSIYQKY